MQYENYELTYSAPAYSFVSSVVKILFLHLSFYSYELQSVH